MGRSLAGLLLLAAAAGAQEVRLQVTRGQRAERFVRQVHAATGQAILYPAAELADLETAAALDVSLPRRNVPDLLVFVLATCRLRVRQFDGVPPLAVVLPSNSLVTEFKLTGLEATVDFNRPPATWRASSDLADALTAASVRELLGLLGGPDAGRRGAAATLLGYAGPRSPEVVRALGEALEDERVAPRAVAALARCGFFARSAIPALKKALQRLGAGHADAVQSAIREIEAALHPALLEPRRARETAPPRFRVRLVTTRGDLLLEVTRAWSPRGADRFFNLVRIGFYDGAAFHRVVEGFVAQFGKHPDPRVNQAWYPATIKGERPRQPNARGYLTFAKGDDFDSRGTQVFINLDDNPHLDPPEKGFAPFGRVLQGMEVAKKLYSGYGDRPQEGRIHYEGSRYLEREFPALDYIRRAAIVR
ncbi:MAG: peptidylprolyl isomerase [Planctomycetota bacterium]